MLTVPIDVERRVLDLVTAGSYASGGDVLRAAINALEMQRSDLAAIQEGIEDVQAGRVYSLEEAFEQLTQKRTPNGQ